MSSGFAKRQISSAAWLSTVLFENTRNWLIGGSTDAESNVLMGVRCGFTINGSSNMVLRGNYSQHNYPHRFSQGENFQLDGDGFLVEHNVIRSSSWPVRGIGGELRYNLIDASGNSDQVLQGPMSNTNIHHNIFSFTVSQTLYSPGAGVKLMYNVDNVQFHNNVMDGGGTFMGFYGIPISVIDGSFLGSLRNNVFYNFAGLSGQPVVAGDLGESGNPAPGTWQVHRRYMPWGKGSRLASGNPGDIFPARFPWVINAARIFLRGPGEKRPRKPDFCSVSGKRGTRDQPP